MFHWIGWIAKKILSIPLVVFLQICDGRQLLVKISGNVTFCTALIPKSIPTSIVQLYWSKNIYKHNLHQCHHHKVLTAITKFHPQWQILTRLSGFISNIMAHINTGLSSLPLPQPLLLSSTAPANSPAAISLTAEYKSVYFMCCVFIDLLETMNIQFFIHHHPSSATEQNPMPQTIAAIQLLLPVKQCD